jgi:hypothetical protein
MVEAISVFQEFRGERTITEGRKVEKGEPHEIVMLSLSLEGYI